MTKEEHIARAVLLGCRYNYRCGYYFGPNGIRFDAMTVEPLNLEDAANRIRASEKTARPWYPHD